MVERARRKAPWGTWIMLASALAGLLSAAIYTFNSGNGIAFTPGTYLVLGSTFLLFSASLVIAFGPGVSRGLRGTLLVLMLLDFLGTATAAWFLMAWFLVAFMVVGLVGWLIHLVADRRPAPHAHHEAYA